MHCANRQTSVPTVGPAVAGKLAPVPLCHSLGAPGEQFKMITYKGDLVEVQVSGGVQHSTGANAASDALKWAEEQSGFTHVTPPPKSTQFGAKRDLTSP